jgi:hypothetical protein
MKEKLKETILMNASNLMQKLKNFANIHIQND